MPFALIFVGAIIIVSAFRGTYSQLGTQLSSDFGSGSQNFLIWLAAIVAVGALGYSPVLRTPSRLLLALIFFAMLISNQGFYAKFVGDLQTQPTPVQAPPGQDPALTGSVPVQLQGGGSTPSSLPGQAANAASRAKTALNVVGGIGSLFGL